jgi:hypothetical protein
MTSTVIDHVGLVGRDVHAMRVAFERLGFVPTPPKLLMRWDAKTGERESLCSPTSPTITWRATCAATRACISSRSRAMTSTPITRVARRRVSSRLP